MRLSCAVPHPRWWFSEASSPGHSQILSADVNSGEYDGSAQLKVLGHERIPKVDSCSARGLVYFISERSHMSPDPMLRDYKLWLRSVHGSSRLSVSPCLWRRSGVSGCPMQVRHCTVCTLFNIHLSDCILFRNPPFFFVSMQMQRRPLPAIVSFHH